MAGARVVAVKMERKRCIHNITKLGLVDELFERDGQAKVGAKDVSQVF